MTTLERVYYVTYEEIGASIREKSKLGQEFVFERYRHTKVGILIKEKMKKPA
ncbi:MAG: hypothetical protein LBU34_07345 [Planctomycetaceae bacterium]|nr:hypothetical protein [Planctomycetaceae bacterium]